MNPLRVLGLGFGGLLAALLTLGCGSVGEVGSGASRGGVDPVRGTYGYSASGSAVDAQKQADRVQAVAKANQVIEKKSAALANKIKASADETGAAVAEVEVPEQATLDPVLKALVVQEEAPRPGSAEVPEDEVP